MFNIVDKVSNNLLSPYNLSLNSLEDLYAALLTKDSDFADIFCQKIFSESWYLEDGLIKDLSQNISQGIGFRLVHAETTGYAYTENFTLASMHKAVHAARAISSSGGQGIVNASHNIIAPQLYTDSDPLLSISNEDKVGLLHDLDRLARSQSHKVEKVTASLNARYEEVLIRSASGAVVADIRPLVRLGVSVVCSDGSDRQTASASVGGRYESSRFLDKQVLTSLAQQAVDLALLQFDAVAAPAGSYPVVLGPGWPGVLLHEAVGHGLEGDFNRKGSSAFSGKMGEKVASECCTIVDNGAIADRRGSIAIDDEGTIGQRTVLIENGRLVSYLQDNLNASLMGVTSTGNGRRESYEYAPIPRMTNTYLEAGPHGSEEIIASVDKGIYAVNFSGGQVDITSGKFVFTASEAYMIENGKVTYPVKGATLIGDGASVLHEISMVGNDFALDQGIGVCGKDGQGVPVGVGQPTIKVNNLTIGGTEA